MRGHMASERAKIKIERWICVLIMRVWYTSSKHPFRFVSLLASLTTKPYHRSWFCVTRGTNSNDGSHMAIVVDHEMNGPRKRLPGPNFGQKETTIWGVGGEKRYVRSSCHACTSSIVCRLYSSFVFIHWVVRLLRVIICRIQTTFGS